MALKQAFSRQWVYLAIFLLIFIWSWKLFGLRMTLHDKVYDASEPWPLEVYDHDTFNPQAIRAVCDTTDWTPGLIFTCEEGGGGVGNLRNSILNCVRYAIHAGASMVVPRIVKRNDSDTTKIWGQSKVDMDWLFDRVHFVDSLQLACPQMHIIASQDDIPHRETAYEAVKMKPEDLVDDTIPATGLDHPEKWRAIFYSWLHQYATPTETNPMIIHLARSYLQYPVHSDGEDFSSNFGKMLQIRYDARLLASKVLFKIQKMFDLTFNQRAPYYVNAFFGVHLRTEEDARQAWPTSDSLWENGRFDKQAELYLEQAPRSNSSFIYVASGEQGEATKFAMVAKEKIGMMVLNKQDLLTGDDLAHLKAMAFDQQALIDFLVLMRASDFAGVAHSSFSWNIALKRHQYSNVSQYLDGPQMLNDELSQIIGQPRKYPEYEACMWP